MPEFYFKTSDLTHQILTNANIGLWMIEAEDGKEPRMYGDEKMMELMGVTHDMSPEEVFQMWMANIEPEYASAVNEYTEKMTTGHRAAVQYCWRHPVRGSMFVRCEGIRNMQYTEKIRFEGCHQDISELYNVRLQAEEKEKYSEIVQALGLGYECIYYVDVIDNHYQKINSSGMFKDLLLPDAGKHFFEEFQMQFMNYLHQEDLKVFADFMQKDFLLQELNNSGTSSVLYRLVFNGKIEFFRMKALRSDVDRNHIVLAFENISDEQQTKKELEQREKRYYAAIKALSSEYGSIYYVEIEKNVLTPYSNSERIMGKFGQSAFSGMSCTEAIDAYVNNACLPKDRDMLKKVLSFDYMRNRLKEKPYFTVIYQNDKSHYCEMKCVRVDENPAINCVVVGFADKDDEIRTDMERQQKFDQNMAVISGLTSDFVFVVYVNYETGKEVLYRLDPVLEKLIVDWDKIPDFQKRLEAINENVVHPDDRAHFKEATLIEKVIEEINKNSYYYVNFRLQIDGHDLYYQAKFVKDAKRENHFIAGFHNVDSEMRREMSALEKAEAASRAKSTFLFNMSHDIRTPMNAIMGFTDMAIKNVENKKKTLDCLSKAKLSSEHLLSLINDILDMSRIESGKLELNEIPVDIRQCEEDTLPMLRSLAEKKNIAFNVNMEGIKDRYVMVDFLHVNQAIINIVSNAVKYTPEGGCVSFTISQIPCTREGYALYSFVVEDNGVGMSEEYLTHVFEEFSREKTSTVSKQQGTGLGLAITKSIVNMMGGSIDVKSVLKKGSTFTMKIPLRLQKNPESVEQTRFTNVNRESVNFRGMHVLVVDDNVLNREISVDMLEDSGFIVETAEDGAIAVNKLLAKGPDYYNCILMDVQMPVMDGYEATKIIRGMFPGKHVPIVALSANAFEEDQKKSLEAGMDAHLSKPVVLSLLLEALRKLV